MDSNLLEVHRLAQAALTTATEAAHHADLVEKTILSHEQICGERYGTIKDDLKEVKQAQSFANADHKSSIEKVYLVLDTLRTTAGKAAGLDLAFRYFCLLVGMGGVIWGVLK